MRVHACFHVLSIALAVAATGCGSDSEAPGEPDAALDTAAADTNVDDTGVLDTSPEDTSVVADSGVADSAVADTGLADTAVADTGVADTAVADTSVADTSVADTAVADTGVADTGSERDADATADTPTHAGLGYPGAAYRAPADTADAMPLAVCGNGVIESGEACEPASMPGLTSLTQKVAVTFNDVNHCSLRCERIVFSSLGSDITKLGPAHPADLALDRVLYARVSTNNWNPSGGSDAYDYRQYYRIVLPVKTRLDIYSMAANVFEDGKWYLYSTGGTLYTAMELLTLYGADKTTRVGGYNSVRGNPDASPPYAALNTIELAAGTYYLAIATPYWTASKPTAFTVYTYIEQHPM